MDIKNKKDDQLGMSYGTASHQLKKNILYDLVVRLNLNNCYHCGEKINTSEELSVEHKNPWLDSEDPKGLFFNLDNIAFSHFKCNCAGARNVNKGRFKHPSSAAYNRRGCRCEGCVKIMKEYNKTRWQRIKK